MLHILTQAEVLGPEEARFLTYLSQTARASRDLIPFLVWVLWGPLEEQPSLTFVESSSVPVSSTSCVLPHYVPPSDLSRHPGDYYPHFIAEETEALSI